MKLNANFADMFFTELSNVVVDPLTGGIGFTADGNIYTFAGDTVTSNPMSDMAFSLPAFAMRVARNTLEAGDIVVTKAGKNASGSLAFVKSYDREADVLRVVNGSGVEFELGKTKSLFFGAEGTVMALKANFLGGAEGGMNNMMLMLALAGDKSEGNSDPLKMVMMMQAMQGGLGGSNGAMNPLMLLALMK